MPRPLPLAPAAAVALLGGALGATAFAPLAWWPLLPLAPATLAWATFGQSVRRGALLGLLLGAAFFGVHLLWLRSVGWDAVALLGGLETAFFVPLGAYAALVSRLRAWPVFTALGWVAVETLRSRYPLGGFPWGRLGFGTPDSPWAAGLPLFSVAGTGLLLALCGTTIVWLALRWPRPAAGALAVVGLLAASLVPVAASYAPRTEGEVVVAAVQGNVPGRGTDILADYRGVTRNQRDATLALADDVAAGLVPQPDLVVWPENSTAIDPFLDQEMTDAITESVRALGVPLLVGAIVDAPKKGQVLNQGIVWDPVTGAGERYTKHHPVPFGEYIPWRDRNPLTSRFERFAQISRDMLAGTGTTPLDIAGVGVADALCYDIAFDDVVYPQVRRGGELLTVQTSNATYSRTEQLDQQFQITRARAIETGRAVAVASTNGLSGVIGPDGAVLDTLPRRSQGYALATVALTTGVPPSVVLGPWVGWISVVAAILAAVAALGGYPRAFRRGPTPATRREPRVAATVGERPGRSDQ